jgi:hypothetical protein
MWPSFEQLSQIVGFLSAVIGIVSALFAAMAWWKARAIRREQLDMERLRSEAIRLTLVRESDGAEHTLDYCPRRDQATRNEILGILGMYFGQTRFDSSKLVPVLESGDFDRMISGEVGELKFVVSDDDFIRFETRDAELRG